MKTSYEARCRAATYVGDVQCELRLQPDPRDEDREATVGWISERLLSRLRHLALAYELPLLGRLSSDGSVSYPEVQFSAVEDELEFLYGIVTDGALLNAIAPLRTLIQQAARDPRGWSLRVELP